MPAKEQNPFYVSLAFRGRVGNYCYVLNLFDTGVHYSSVNQSALILKSKQVFKFTLETKARVIQAHHSISV